MPSDTKNVKLGVCQIRFGGFDLGYTKGGVEVEVKTETKKVMIDQFGNSEVNEIILGRTCTAKVPMAETTLYKLAEIMPGATLSLSGGAYAEVSFTFTAFLAAGTANFNGVIFTSRGIANVDGPRSFWGQGGGITNEQAAVNFANVFNNTMDSRITDFRAFATGATVTFRADQPGAAFNGFTFTNTMTGTASGPSTAGGIDPPIAKLTVGNGASISLLNSARRLVLHPIARGNDERVEDFIMPLAATAGEFSMAYKLDDERIFMPVFTAYPDIANGNLLFVIGEEWAN